MGAETVEDEDVASSALSRGRHFPWLEFGAGVVYAAGLLAYTVAYGAPLKTLKIFVAIMVGLLVPMIRNPRRWVRGVLRDWLPLLVVLFSYDVLRGRADNVNTVVHYEPQLGIDKLLGGGEPLSSVLQDQFWKGTPSWYDHVVSTVYLSHFCVTLIVLAVLWVVREDVFRRFRNVVLTVVLAAFATYFIYPAAPPWLAAYTDRAPPIVRTVGLTLHAKALGASPVLPGHGPALANPVAALPSLHGALPLLLALFFWRRVRKALRAVLVLYPLAMAFVLIYGGEHYAFDIVMGWAYVVAAYLVWTRIWRRADRRAVTAEGSDVQQLGQPVG